MQMHFCLVGVDTYKITVTVLARLVARARSDAETFDATKEMNNESVYSKARRLNEQFSKRVFSTYHKRKWHISLQE